MPPPDPHHLKAFQQTTYVVAEPHLSICIGDRHPQLDAWLGQQQASTWAFLTAWNPKSRQLAIHENTLLLNGLRNDLKPYLTCPGKGVPDNPGWQPEESFLVMGISREDALLLARKWNQLAFLYGEAGGLATLVWC